MIEVSKLESAKRLSGLLGKIWAEALDYKQLLDPERRKTLARNAMRGFRSLKYKPTTYEQTIVAIQNDHVWHAPYKGLEAATFQGLIAGIVLPENVMVDYEDTRGFPNIDFNLFTVVGPTYYRQIDGMRDWMVPSEGFRRGNNVREKFKYTGYDGTVPTGAVFVDTDISDVQILKTEAVVASLSEQMSESQFLIGGNWYMDSETAADTVLLPALQDLQVHNGIGEMHYSGGKKRLFTINSAEESLRSLNNVFPFEGRIAKIEIPSVMVAGMCETLSARTSAIGWNYVGLEYRHGGSYLPEFSDDFRETHSFHFNPQ